jgi:hypothetical protein
VLAALMPRLTKRWTPRSFIKIKKRGHRGERTVLQYSRILTPHFCGRYDLKTPITGIVLSALMMLAGLSMLIGCSSQPSPSTATQANIQTAADVIAENILSSLNNNDYPVFSKDFDQNLKNILTRTSFDQLYQKVKSTLGDYQSKDLITATTQSDITTLQYVAHYTNEPAGVAVTLSLQNVNHTIYVHGLNLDSSKLRGQSLDVNQIRGYADSETENVVVSLNNNNYAGFSKDFDQAMKTLTPETAYVKLYNQIKTLVGDYQSDQFESLSQNNNIITVLYLAKYSNEPDGVWISISFDSDTKIGGLYFISPKLLAAPK